jgi:hypothetical protein
MPAKLDLKAKGVQRLAVSDFTGGPEGAGHKIADLFTAKLVEGQYFQVAEREKLLALEKEQALGMTGVVDATMAAKAGKLLGVDALVVGTVLAYNVKDEPYIKTVMQTITETDCDKQGKCSHHSRQVPVEEHHHIRNGVVTVAYRLIRAETGEMLAGRQETATYQYDTGHPPSAGFLKDRIPELEHEAVLTKLAQEVVEKLVADLQPHPVTVEREFETGGWLFADSDITHGIELVKANRVADAAQWWEGVVQRDPQNSAAHYNLGLAYELLGQFEQAEQHFRAAERLRPDPRYIQAVAQVREARAAAKKLAEQTTPRGTN